MGATRYALLPLLAACVLGAPTTIPATDPRLYFTGGRTVINGTSVRFDWEGTTLSFCLTSTSKTLALLLSDTSRGGSRFAVTWTIPGSAPSIKSGLLLTSSVQTVYTLSPLSGIETATTPACVEVTLLTEPAYTRAEGSNSSITVVGILTDGTVAAPPPATRKLLFLGDSLTAGYGSGFDLPTPSSLCGGGVLTNDVTNSYGWRITRALGAEGSWVAVSGITLFAGGKGLPGQYANALGGWPVSEGGPTVDFSRFVPDGVIVNLGENDWHAAGAGSPSFIADYQKGAFGWRAGGTAWGGVSCASQ